MSSYSKPSSSFQKQIPYQKLQKSKERNIKPVDNKKPTNISTGDIGYIKCNTKVLVPGRYPNSPSNKSVSSTTKTEIVKNPQIISDQSADKTCATTTSVASNETKNGTDFSKITKNKNTGIKNSSVLSGPANKFHTGSNNNNSGNKWRRNNFPVFCGGYPSPARINLPSTIPFFGRGYPTDTSLYLHSGIYPPHYSPVHHPHLRHQHLTQHRFLAVSPVSQTHPYHKYLAISHIGNIRRSRSAHGSFRSKVSSPHHQQANSR